MMDKRTQGDQAEALAISYLIREGYTVSVPFSENQAYDLVAEKYGQFHAVQVKSCSARVGNSWSVDLRTCGWNSQGANKKTLDSSQIDFLFVWTPDNLYFIEAEVLPTSSLSLTDGGKYDKYIVTI